MKYLLQSLIVISSHIIQDISATQTNAPASNRSLAEREVAALITGVLVLVSLVITLYFWQRHTRNRNDSKKNKVLMTFIYVWEAFEGSVGHCSLLLDNGTYVSWWPKGNASGFKKKKKVNAQGHLPDNYEEDVEEMGRYATHRFHISSEKVNTLAISKWWSNYKIEGYGYNLISHNCCDVVLKALKKGGAWDWRHPGMKIMSTPEYMVRYGRSLSDAKRKDSSWFYIL
ncbi:uncharacterized protein LOC127723272 [Mytilus californianus]|uniref:uncharacterized protein LOC127723272 n=1 Tax=Mytilus californianus TaxID=6549 RepID=UPI002246C0A3|nr:uncharacterized protein LOC127723272 [Mytilus californianus]